MPAKQQQKCASAVKLNGLNMEEDSILNTSKMEEFAKGLRQENPDFCHDGRGGSDLRMASSHWHGLMIFFWKGHKLESVGIRQIQRMKIDGHSKVQARTK